MARQMASLGIPELPSGWYMFSSRIGTDLASNRSGRARPFANL